MSLVVSCRLCRKHIHCCILGGVGGLSSVEMVMHNLAHSAAAWVGFQERDLCNMPPLCLLRNASVFMSCSTLLV